MINTAIAYLTQVGMNDPNVIQYFARFDYNIQEALTPGLGPEVNVNLALPYHGQSGDVDSMQLGNSCFTASSQVQSIASTITHELGHIAAYWYAENNPPGSQVDLSDINFPDYSSIDNSSDEMANPEGYAAEWVWWGFYWSQNDTWQ